MPACVVDICAFAREKHICIGCADNTGAFTDCLVLKLTAVRSQIACLPSMSVNCVMLAVVVVVVLCLSVAVGGARGRGSGGGRSLLLTATATTTTLLQ